MSTMRSATILPPPPASPPYSLTNPAPSTAMHITTNTPLPPPPTPSHVLIRVKATTIIRDTLTWPELYPPHTASLGNDFSGTISETHPSETDFQVGDEVYGMLSAEKGGAWAEFIVASKEEVWRKPAGLGWEEAACVPLSGMTAEQALGHAGVGAGRRVLVTGAGGGVGMLVVQLAKAEGCVVVAGSRSSGRDGEFLRGLGADEVVEYGDLGGVQGVDAVIDTVGGEVLKQCWKVVKKNGSIISVDSSSWDFVNQHRQSGVAAGREDVKAKFFIVEPSQNSLRRLAQSVEAGNLKVMVARTFDIEDVREAYDLCESGKAGKGKIVLTL